MMIKSNNLSVLEYLQRQLEGTLTGDDVTHMRYPTAISGLLDFCITDIGEAMAVIELEADAQRHGIHARRWQGRGQRIKRSDGLARADRARPLSAVDLNRSRDRSLSVA